MELKDTAIQVKRLSNDAEYFNNVFKKSEKVSAVILYLLSFVNDDQKDSLINKSLEKKSFNLHEVSLRTLQTRVGDQTSLIELRHSLLEVMSTLEVAVAARSVAADIAQAVIEQVDAINRHLTNHYLDDQGVVLEQSKLINVNNKSATSSVSEIPQNTSAPKPRPRRQQRVSVPAGDISSDAYIVYSQLTDRAERIKTVLEAKPQATVKDVAEIVTDVSEKTIQRELNSLIEKGQVMREGERRWSKYSVVKD